VTPAAAGPWERGSLRFSYTTMAELEDVARMLANAQPAAANPLRGEL